MLKIKFFHCMKLMDFKIVKLEINKIYDFNIFKNWNLKNY
jgi:hypothetical protein